MEVSCTLAVLPAFLLFGALYLKDSELYRFWSVEGPSS